MPSPYQPCPNEWVLRPISLNNPQLPCTFVSQSQFTLDAWAANYINKPRVNPDGKLFPSQPCFAVCDTRNQKQITAVAGQPEHNYNLPGGLMIGPEFYVNCA
jgi:hypothetical protein